VLWKRKISESDAAALFVRSVGTTVKDRWPEISSALGRVTGARMRLTVVTAFLLLLVTACDSGSSSSVTAPTPVRPPEPQAPTPQFPNLIGSWRGTLVVNAAIAGLTGSNTCTVTWLITSQTSGRFAGTYQSSGGTSCASSGTVSGEVSSSETLIRLDLVQQVGSPGCVVLSRTGYSGFASATVITAQETQQNRCTVRGTSATGSRTLTFDMQKR